MCEQSGLFDVDVLSFEGVTAVPEILEEATHRDAEAAMLEYQRSELRVTDNRIVKGDHAALVVKQGEFQRQFSDQANLGPFVIESLKAGAFLFVIKHVAIIEQAAIDTAAQKIGKERFAGRINSVGRPGKLEVLISAL